MRNSLPLLSAVLLTLVACGASDSPSEKRAVEPSVPTSGLDAIFVSSSLGSPEGDGTFSRPVQTLSEAIRLAQRTGVGRVIACAETFSEQIEITRGSVAIEGGYACENLAWRESDRSARLRSVKSPAIRIANADSISITKLEVFAENVTADAMALGSSPNAVALEVRNTKVVNVARSRIRAGRGLNGASAALTEGYELDAALARGQAGAPPGVCDAAPCNAAAGGAGGVMKCTLKSSQLRRDTGTGRSGAGVIGGAGGVYSYATKAWSLQPEAGATGLQLGTRAAMNQDGPVGADGARGKNGETLAGTLDASGYTPGPGTHGSDGEPGFGGGGGGSGGEKTVMCGVDVCPALPFPLGASGSWRGPSGGGGGAGGCPGRAASSSEGGGASIALFVIESDVSLDAVTVETVGGGRGGEGRTGAEPTSGGGGGRGGGPFDGTGAPFTGAGGKGGTGGWAGYSAHGSNGPSYGIVYAGTIPRLLNVQLAVGPGGEARTGPPGPDRIIPATPEGESKEIKLLTR